LTADIVGLGVCILGPCAGCWVHYLPQIMSVVQWLVWCVQRIFISVCAIVRQ